ncbi:GGDEF domain-containing protein [Nitratidesulfovibrio liaohensis]|uniref:diguanylate cyclase n=1 Tax=Nitratidesulfovibrio liaohensis TaxID=2604158 RepID=A0ABY9R2T1_9BACT|nr:GGDEF domain-containing protein [Nitratidesulfovibrio liaohensis]WMW66065.1 GGDEF domain-containing protein [Nitratidesulfovibrio liaohensis]
MADNTCNCSHRQCTFSGEERLCEILDRAGVPHDSKWRTLVFYMRGLGEFSTLNDDQKARIQQLLVDVLHRRDFSEQSYHDILRADRDIRVEPYECRMREALQEAERLAREFRAMLHQRRGDMDKLEQESVRAVESGLDPAEVVRLLRATFSEVREQMDNDAIRVGELTVTDPLTGLGNRRAFDMALAAGEAAWKGGTGLALVLFDVDRFKRINDQHGHRIGDQVLRTVAEVLRRKVDDCNRNLDDGGEGGRECASVVARYGGEEFALVLTGEGAQQAAEIAESVRAGLEGVSFAIRDGQGQVVEHGVRVTLSAGVAHAGPNMAEPLADNLFDLADKALYEAKREGRNRVRVAIGAN